MSDCPCPICNHPVRTAIEMAMLKCTPDNSDKVVERISRIYKVSKEDVHEHMLFHTFIGDDAEEDSIVRKLKLREADILGAAVVEQMATMQAVGQRIRKAALSDSEDLRFEKTLTKPMVDLYNGPNDGMRQNIQALADINQLLNGPQASGISGLMALTQVLKDSRGYGDTE